MPELISLNLKICFLGLVFLVVTPTILTGSSKAVVAHRGASAYAPEHTIASYKLALLQGADFIEQDLQVTKDGILVCRHDSTLERTTNVASLYPNRFSRIGTVDNSDIHWYIKDFTLKELKTLDAGSWFDKKFSGSRILTFAEAVNIVRGKAGIYPELKDPEFYSAQGFDIISLFLEELKKLGLENPDQDTSTPVIIQCFSAETLKRLKKSGCRHPATFLIGQAGKNWLSQNQIKKISSFAEGIGPDKNLIYEDPSIVSRARGADLTVTPYTFRKMSFPEQFSSVTEEMKYMLYTLGADALFTDNPDLFPRE
jgi:glycerophosphoryl diester phosphodiesterase